VPAPIYILIAGLHSFANAIFTWAAPEGIRWRIVGRNRTEWSNSTWLLMTKRDEWVSEWRYLACADNIERVRMPCNRNWRFPIILAVVIPPIPISSNLSELQISDLGAIVYAVGYQTSCRNTHASLPPRMWVLCPYARIAVPAQCCCGICCRREHGLMDCPVCWTWTCGARHACFA